MKIVGAEKGGSLGDNKTANHVLATFQQRLSSDDTSANPGEKQQI
jgi:hypothetical protein